MGGTSELVVDVVIVARNCARALDDTLTRLPRKGVRSVVVVDNGSSDATGQVARDRGAIVLRAPKGGYGTGCLRAQRHLETLPNPPNVVVFIDPRGPEDPAELGALLEPFRNDNAELVLAMDPAERARPAVTDRAMLGLISVLYGHNFHELSAFRAVRFSALVALGLGDARDAWNVEMQVKAVRLGLHIVEVPIARRLEKAGGLGDTRKGVSAGRKLLRILRHATAR